MAKYRSLLAILLAFVAVLVISLGRVAEAKPLSYTSTQIEDIQNYAAELTTLRDRLPELATLIQNENWTFVRNFIHGPLGEMRSKMVYITRNLLPDERLKATDLEKETFKNLVAIDQAAEKGNYSLAMRSYGKVISKLDAFLELVPKA